MPDLTDGKLTADLQIVDAAAGPDHLDGEIGRVLQARRNGCRDDDPLIRSPGDFAGGMSLAVSVGAPEGTNRERWECPLPALQYFSAVDRRKS